MAWGNQEHAPCKSSPSTNVGANYPEGWGGRHQPTIKRKVQHLKNSLQNDERPDGRFGLRIETLNTGSLRGKVEVCEEQCMLHKVEENCLL